MMSAEKLKDIKVCCTQVHDLICCIYRHMYVCDHGKPLLPIATRSQALWKLASFPGSSPAILVQYATKQKAGRSLGMRLGGSLAGPLCQWVWPTCTTIVLAMLFSHM